MRKRLAIEALEKSIAQWQKLAETGWRSKKVAMLSVYPNLSVWAFCGCYLCEAVLSYRKPGKHLPCVKHCPIKPNRRYGCETDTPPYVAWLAAIRRKRNPKPAAGRVVTYLKVCLREWEGKGK